MSTALTPAFPTGYKFKFPVHIFIFPLVLALGLTLVGVHEREGVFATAALMIAVATGGVALIERLSKRLGDRRLRNLSSVFLLKLFFTLVLLYVGWTPLLDPTSASFGYDPQRYYFEANTLADSDFSFLSLPSLNYTGILFYYGAIFAIFGHNPAVPALINVFVTLLATMMLVRAGYLFKPERRSYDWTLGLVMVIPEVMWYDALTSRETLVMSLLVLCIVPLSRLFLKMPGDDLSRWHLLWVIPVVILLATVRAPMVIPVLGLMSVYVFVSRKFRRQVRLFGMWGLLLILGIIFIVPVILERLGSYQFDYLLLLGSAMMLGENSFDPAFQWSERSVGQMFIPTSIPEIILFAPVRLLIYLVTPLPNIAIDPVALSQGHWGAWQHLMALMSGALYVLLTPYLLGAFFHIRQQKRQSTFWGLQAPFLILFIAIAVGNLGIFDRYRTMIVPFLWGCIWLGWSCRPVLIRRLYLGWFCLLALGGIFFTGYKSF